MDSLLVLILSAAAMTAIVGTRYLLVSGAFAWATKLREPGLYAGLDIQIKREIGWSLASAAIYGIPAGIVAWGWDSFGWTQIYTDVNAFPAWYLPVSVFLYLGAHDTWFYWTHRLMHRPFWFKAAHAVHHESRPPTAWAAMAFHPWEALSGAFVIPVLVFLTIMGVTNHMGWECFPKFIVNGSLGRWLITATHHQKHHDAYRGNYGLYFRFWDKMCGTDLGLGDWSRRPHERS
jgi:sterol desaturase/sphingolipid hydroxylase (fatty acid hydroxylase superfamily)